MYTGNAIVSLMFAAAAAMAYAAESDAEVDSSSANASLVELQGDQREDVLVTQFVGSGDQRTLGFSVGGSWELRWRVEPMTQFDRLGGFRADVYDAATNRLLGSVGDNARNDSGVERIAGDGRFYLNINARNVNWEIDVVDVAEPWATAGYKKQADSAGRLVVIEDPDELEALRSAATGDKSNM